MAGSLWLGWLALALGALAAHGFGVAGLRVLRFAPAPWAVTTAIGLAVLVLLGAIVNLLSLAVPAGLITVAGIGLMADGWWWVRGGWRRQWSAVRGMGAVSAVSALLTVVLVLSFVAATQFPPTAYNAVDDLEKYFAFPARMLATGTLASGPLNALGIETLGGQSWLQGFLLVFLPMSYINGLDALLCLGLAMMLALSFAGHAAEPPTRLRLVPIGALAALALVAIDPQIVNVSALYSGVALSMGLMVWLVDQPTCVGWRDGLVPGLVLAALVACKPSLGLLPALLILATAMARSVQQRAWWSSLASVARAVLWSVAFLAPWLALYANKYAAVLPSTSLARGVDGVDAVEFFSDQLSAYGAAPVCYSLALLGGATLAAWCYATRQRSNPQPYPRAMVLAAAASVAAFVGVIWLLGTFQSSFYTALRYGLIVAIAFVPLAIVAAWRWAGSMATASRFGALLLTMLVVGLFAPSLAMRVDRAWNMHHALALRVAVEDPDYLTYIAARLSDYGRARSRRAQQTVPPGVPIVVWTKSPFEMDFVRNAIIDVQPTALATPWASVPPADYLIWEYRGYVVRDVHYFDYEIATANGYELQIALRTRAFLHTLDTAVRSGRVLFNDGYVVVVQLAAPLGQEWRSAGH